MKTHVLQGSKERLLAKHFVINIGDLYAD